MISINVRGGSVKSLKKSYYAALLRWVGICPICQRPFWRHGSYPRITPQLLGTIYIQRVYCENCKKTHALLPCFIIPFARVLDVVREAAIMSICHNLHTIEELAEFLGVDPTTIARWWRIFRTKAGVMLQALSAILAQTSPLADWARGNFDTWRERGRKILELIGRCRATFYPGFMFCGLAWVNLLDPYLLFKRKGMPDRTPGSACTG